MSVHDEAHQMNEAEAQAEHDAEEGVVHVEVNAPSITIRHRDARPSSFMLVEHVGVATDHSTGEEIVMARSATNPFVFCLTGEKLEAEFNITAMMQEIMLHVAKANVKVS